MIERQVCSWGKIICSYFEGRDTMIKLVVFDIDGVLTNGDVWVDEVGREYKSYRLTEIDSLNSLKQKGYRIAAITGEDTAIVKVFQRKVKWDAFICGCKDKRTMLQTLQEQFGLSADEICYIGDGKYDAPAIAYAGLGVAPANAIEAVKCEADVTLNGKGGESCVAELEALLDVRNKT